MNTQDLLNLSAAGRLFGTMFRTLGGHNGRGLWGDGPGIPATVQPCPAGVAVYFDGAFKCVINSDKPIHSDGKLVWWGSSVTLHIDDCLTANMQRAPL